jgi:hypothetical protein
VEATGLPELVEHCAKQAKQHDAGDNPKADAPEAFSGCQVIMLSFAFQNANEASPG